MKKNDSFFLRVIGIFCVLLLVLPAQATDTRLVTARYRGDSNFNGATSAQLTSGGASSFTLAASTVNSSGPNGVATVMITPVGGFNQMVALSCGAVPAQVRCTLSPSSVKLDGMTTATSVLTISGQYSCNDQSINQAGGFPILIVALSALFLPRKRLRALLMAACLCIAASGCNGLGSQCFAPAGTYTINVTGSGTVEGQRVTSSATVQITVSSGGAVSN